MGILDKLKKALDVASKNFTIQAVVPKIAKATSDYVVDPILNDVKENYQNVQKVKAVGDDYPLITKAAAYTPIIASFMNPRVTNETKAALEGKDYTLGDRLIDVGAGAARGVQKEMPLVFPVATAVGIGAGKATELATGTNLIDKLSESAAAGSNALTTKVVNYLPGLSTEQKDRLSKASGEGLKLVAEIIAARVGGRALNKAIKPGELAAGDVAALTKVRPSAIGEALGMASADLGLSQFDPNGSNNAGKAAGTTASFLANAVVPGIGKRKGKSSKLNKPLETPLLETESTIAKDSIIPPEDSIILEKKLTKPFNQKVADLELTKENNSGIVSPTRKNPAYEKFWKGVDAKKAEAPVIAKSDANVDDYYGDTTPVEPVKKTTTDLLKKAAGAKANKVKPVVTPKVKEVELKPLDIQEVKGVDIPKVEYKPLQAGVPEEVTLPKQIVEPVKPVEPITQEPYNPSNIPETSNSKEISKVLNDKDTTSATKKIGVRNVPFTTGLKNTLSSRTSLNQVKDASGTGVGDTTSAILESRPIVAEKLLDKSGLGEKIKGAIDLYNTNKKAFTGALSTILAQMRSSRLRNVKVSNDNGALTFGQWADVLSNERNSQDRSWLLFGDNESKNAARDLGVLDSAISLMKNGGKDANTAIDTVLKNTDPSVVSTISDLSESSKQAGNELSTAGGKWMVDNGLLSENELNPNYKHDYVPEPLFKEYKKTLLEEEGLTPEERSYIQNMDYGEYLASQGNKNLSKGIVRALSPLTKKKVNATNIHIPGDVSRVIHQADRIADSKQKSEAFDFVKTVASKPNSKIANTWSGALSAMMGIGDTSSKYVSNGKSKLSKGLQSVIGNIISPLMIGLKPKLLLQAAYTGVSSVAGEAAMNPSRFVKNLYEIAKITMGKNKLSDALQTANILERDIDSRASIGEKARSFMYSFGGRPVDQRVKTYIAYQAIQDMAGKTMSLDEAANWLNDKIKKGSASERAKVIADITHDVVRLSDHTSGARSGNSITGNIFFGMLKSYSRNMFGQTLNAVQNSIDNFRQYANNKNPVLLKKAVRDITYPLSLYVGGALVAYGTLLTAKEAQKSLGADEKDLPDNDVLLEQAFNLYNMSTANGVGQMLLQQFSKDATSLVTPSGFYALIDKGGDVYDAAKLASEGNIKGALSKILSGNQIGRMIDDNINTDKYGFSRGDNSLSNYFGIPSEQKAAENLYRNQFVKETVGDFGAIGTTAQNVLRASLPKTFGRIMDMTNKTQDERADILELKKDATNDIINFINSGEKKGFRDFLESILPDEVKYEPSNFSQLIDKTRTNRMDEGSVIANIIGAMPSGFSNPQYEGDFGAWLKELSTKDPESLQVVADAIATPLAQYALELKNGTKNKNTKIDAKFSGDSIGSTVASTIANQYDTPEFVTDAGNKFSLLADQVIKRSGVDGDVDTALSKLESLASTAQGSPSFWKAVAPSIERVLADKLVGADGQKIIDKLKAEGDKYPALEEALKGRLKYLSGSAGDAMYNADKNPRGDTKEEEPIKNTQSLLNKALWKGKIPEQAVQTKNKKQTLFKPLLVEKQKKSASSHSTQSKLSQPKILESLYKAIGARQK